MNYWQRLGDTIAGRITAPGQGAVAIVRVSGSLTRSVMKKISPGLGGEPVSHLSRLCRLFCHPRSPYDKAVLLDEALVTFFEGGRSFTGEDSVEFSVHGNSEIVALLMDQLFAYGVRAAERGEFSFRAFSNGRLDLIQAESIQLLITAKADMARARALKSLEGDLSREISEISVEVERLLAHLEAGIDFSEEALDLLSESDCVGIANSVLSKLVRLAASFGVGRHLDQGFVVTLSGAPNAGKSSLFNALLGRDKAIVTDEAGTTRDLLEAEFLVLGNLVRLRDSAGFREAGSLAEKIGIQRSLGSISESDLCIYVVDSKEFLGQGMKLPALDFLESVPTWYIFNKSDLLSASESQLIRDRFAEFSGSRAILGSALDHEFMQGLIEELGVWFASESDSDPVIWSRRHFELIESARSSMEEFVAVLAQWGMAPELLSVSLMEALNALFALTGRRVDEAVIDRIFKEFCLGK